MTTSLTFIDANLANLNSLITELPANTPYFVLNPNQDGLRQIANILADYHDLSAIHVISHGAPGSVRLGNTLLDQNSLGDHAELLATIGASLTENGDILLYGCDVAAGNSGQSFIRQLAQFTGADIAASSNPTGSADLGGDWRLEKSVGDITPNPYP